MANLTDSFINNNNIYTAGKEIDISEDKEISVSDNVALLDAENHFTNRNHMPKLTINGQLAGSSDTDPAISFKPADGKSGWISWNQKFTGFEIGTNNGDVSFRTQRGGAVYSRPVGIDKPGDQKQPSTPWVDLGKKQYPWGNFYMDGTFNIGTTSLTEEDFKFLKGIKVPSISMDYDSENKEITLKDGDTVISTIDATDFIKDGMVDSAKLEDNNLIITFNTDAGKEEIEIDLSKFINAYTSGDAIDIKDDNSVNVKFDDDTIKLNDDGELSTLKYKGGEAISIENKTISIHETLEPLGYYVSPTKDGEEPETLNQFVDGKMNYQYAGSQVYYIVKLPYSVETYDELKFQYTTYGSSGASIGGEVDVLKDSPKTLSRINYEGYEGNKVYFKLTGGHPTGMYIKGLSGKIDKEDSGDFINVIYDDDSIKLSDTNKIYVNSNFDNNTLIGSFTDKDNPIAVNTNVIATRDLVTGYTQSDYLEENINKAPYIRNKPNFVNGLIETTSSTETEIYNINLYSKIYTDVIARYNETNYTDGKISINCSSPSYLVYPINKDFDKIKSLSLTAAFFTNETVLDLKNRLPGELLDSVSTGGSAGGISTSIYFEGYDTKYQNVILKVVTKQHSMGVPDYDSNATWTFSPLKMETYTEHNVELSLTEEQKDEDKTFGYNPVKDSWEEITEVEDTFHVEVLPENPEVGTTVQLVGEDYDGYEKGHIYKYTSEEPETYKAYMSEAILYHKNGDSKLYGIIPDWDHEPTEEEIKEIIRIENLKELTLITNGYVKGYNVILNDDGSLKDYCFHYEERENFCASSMFESEGWSSLEDSRLPQFDITTGGDGSLKWVDVYGTSTPISYTEGEAIEIKNDSINVKYDDDTIKLNDDGELSVNDEFHVKEMPENPEPNTTVQYIGEDTNEYKKGGIYKYYHQETEIDNSNIVPAYTLGVEGQLLIFYYHDNKLKFVYDESTSSQFIQAYDVSELLDLTAFMPDSTFTIVDDNTIILHNVTNEFTLTRNKEYDIGGGITPIEDQWYNSYVPQVIELPATANDNDTVLYIGEDTKELTHGNLYKYNTKIDNSYKAYYNDVYSQVLYYKDGITYVSTNNSDNVETFISTGGLGVSLIYDPENDTFSLESEVFTRNEDRDIIDVREAGWNEVYKIPNVEGFVEVFDKGYEYLENYDSNKIKNRVVLYNNSLSDWTKKWVKGDIYKYCYQEYGKQLAVCFTFKKQDGTDGYIYLTQDGFYKDGYYYYNNNFSETTNMFDLTSSRPIIEIPETQSGGEYTSVYSVPYIIIKNPYNNNETIQAIKVNDKTIVSEPGYQWVKISEHLSIDGYGLTYNPNKAPSSKAVKTAMDELNVLRQYDENTLPELNEKKANIVIQYVGKDDAKFKKGHIYLGSYNKAIIVDKYIISTVSNALSSTVTDIDTVFIDQNLTTSSLYAKDVYIIEDGELKNISDKISTLITSGNYFTIYWETGGRTSYSKISNPTEDNGGKIYFKENYEWTDLSKDNTPNQVTEMPEANKLYKGFVTQYIGETDGTYEKNKFYECKQKISNLLYSCYVYSNSYGFYYVKSDENNIGDYVYLCNGSNRKFTFDTNELVKTNDDSVSNYYKDIAIRNIDDTTLQFTKDRSDAKRDTRFDIYEYTYEWVEVEQANTETNNYKPQIVTQEQYDALTDKTGFYLIRS